MSKRLADSTCEWFGEHTPGPTTTSRIRRPCGHDDPDPVATCDRHLVTLAAAGGRAAHAVPCPVCGDVNRAWVDYDPQAQAAVRRLSAHWRGDHMPDELGPDDLCVLCSWATRAHGAAPVTTH